MHRRKLDELLVRHGISGLSEAEIADFNRVWHRLKGWPDTVEGLTRLKRTSLKPEQTIETLEEDKEWLKQLT